MTMSPVVQPSPSFVLCRELRPGESLASLVQWHCTENVVPRLSTLFSLLVDCGGGAVRSVHELAQDPASVRALERVTRQPPGSLTHLQRRVLRGAVHGGYETRLVDGAYEWPQHARSSRVQAVCPLCLREAGYARTCWEFVQAPVCLRHRVRLVDHCEGCGAHIEVDRPGLLHCEACAAPLERGRSEPVDEPQLEAARWVQEARTRAFGTSESTIPIEPHDVSGLLRLLLIPRAGEPATWGLGDNLEAIAVERRMDALGLLGSALDGTRLDSARLRAVAMRRWPFAALLPHGERLRLLREACQAVELPPDVTNMLCCDRESKRVSPAAEHFEPEQPPRILELRRLGDRLGLDLPDLRVLMAEESFRQAKPGHYGFDMDEVLRLERALAATQTLEEVDRMLGWPGVATELAGMRLVVGINVVNDGRRVHVPSVTRLFEQARERAVTAGTTTSSPEPLSTAAASLGLDARQVANAIRQLVGGSLRAYGWNEPFNLTSLLVSPNELRALVESAGASSHSSAATPETLSDL